MCKILKNLLSQILKLGNCPNVHCKTCIHLGESYEMCIFIVKISWLDFDFSNCWDVVVSNWLVFFGGKVLQLNVRWRFYIPILHCARFLANKLKALNGINLYCSVKKRSRSDYHINKEIGNDYFLAKEKTSWCQKLLLCNCLKKMFPKCLEWVNLKL